MNPTQNKDEEVKFFDAWAKAQPYVEYGHFTDSGHQAIIKYMKPLVQDRFSAGCKVLDLACGSGAFTRRLAKSIAADCVGVDISPGLITAAKELDTKTQYLIGDVEDLKFADQSFDVVLLSGILHHLPDKTKCLSEAKRVLKKGGFVLAYDPNVKNPFMYFYKHVCLKLLSPKNQTENEKLFSIDEISKTLKQAGLSQLNVQAISGVPFYYVGPKLGQVLLPIYNAIEIALGESSLAKKYGSLIIVCAKKE